MVLSGQSMVEATDQRRPQEEESGVEGGQVGNSTGVIVQWKGGRSGRWVR